VLNEGAVRRRWWKNTAGRYHKRHPWTSLFICIDRMRIQLKRVQNLFFFRDFPESDYCVRRGVPLVFQWGMLFYN